MKLSMSHISGMLFIFAYLAVQRHLFEWLSGFLAIVKSINNIAS
ncbi:hypothetical protein HNQ88_002051 [Aureibacter tunicatorum]|uniref:Uncharacterized protein n=1 Tax=Aureibacter tunicatorum TaxID=866807 RepID=A0AAE3XPP2_9BACT|nr:hypothetical protein [Aureibacter tunicatorum]BDD05060.1 hypothetical protein AUTU_25430 [Aureibacter tunicatorum]